MKTFKSCSMTLLMENIRVHVSYYIRYLSKVYEHIIKQRNPTEPTGVLSVERSKW